MRTATIVLGVVLAWSVSMAHAESAKEPVPVWDLAKDAFAATTGRIERVDGHVRMDGTSAFATLEIHAALNKERGR